MCGAPESVGSVTERIEGITCYDDLVENRTEPKTVRQWIRYVAVAVVALFLVWWMLRLYVF